MSENLTVSDVSLIVGIVDRDGKRYETIIDITSKDYDIINYNLTQSKKVKQTKDDNGSVIGFEPTGELQLKLDLKYLVK
jgi:hypothetical protein